MIPRLAASLIAASFLSGGDAVPETQFRVECACPISVRAGTDTKATFSLQGDGTQPKTFVKGGFRWFVVEGSAASLKVAVPSSYRKIAVYSRSGDLDIRGLTAAVEAEAVYGRVFADAIQGDLIVRSAGGEIKVGKVHGALRAISGGNGIWVGQVDGETWCETAGGEVIIERAGGEVHATTGGGNIYIRDAALSVTAKSDGGLIDVQRSGGIVKAETGGGSIQVGAARGVQCDSLAGAIRIRNLSGTINARTRMGSILAELLPGIRFDHSALVTDAGDITILIPSNLSVSVQATNESRGRMARIFSEFPEIRVNRSPASLPGMIAASGSLNGGGSMLRISAAGGTIYLRRQK